MSEGLPTNPPNPQNESDDFFDAKTKDSHGTGYLQVLSEVITGEKIPDDLIYQSEPLASMITHSERIEGISEYLKRILSGKKILDLGCGTQTSGFRIASFVGAREYVGVEKNKAKTANKNIQEERENSNSTIPYLLVQKDMLAFLNSVEDKGFGCVFLVGIDREIISDDEYWRKLEQEIHRVLSGGGYLLIGGGSYFHYPKEFFEKDFSVDTEFSKIKFNNSLASMIPDLFVKK